MLAVETTLVIYVDCVDERRRGLVGLHPGSCAVPFSTRRVSHITTLGTLENLGKPGMKLVQYVVAGVGTLHSGRN